jgi:hypothetical protein
MGKPRYCRFCRRSFNIKLCPASHPNIRGTSFCELCGSPDLSVPQPRLSGAIHLAYILGVFVLMAASFIYILYFARALLSDPDALLKPMLIGALLGLVWLGVIVVTDASR